jgi:Ser/Thr protein kinase RdoA (MazF antagonist)
MFEKIFSLFGFQNIADVKSFGNGLINNTWVFTFPVTNERFILQRINTNIFKQPENISANISSLQEYFIKNHPDYHFEAPVKTPDGKSMIHLNEGHFRIFRFVPNSHTVDVVTNPEEAFEAARQFGTFTALLNNFPAAELKTTLPDFHNLGLRYNQFEQALINGNKERILQSEESIKFLKANKNIVDKVSVNFNLPLRVIHHDTKISNVLFNENNKGICVIDLDTVMPGYFISDLGDMMRTYLSPVSEEENDFSKITVRVDFFKSIIEGYLYDMKNVITPAEEDFFVYSGKFMIYMQALRFITDHLNNDSYYGSKYPGHNFVRGNNQIELLKRYMECEPKMNEIVKNYLSINTKN